MELGLTEILFGIVLILLVIYYYETNNLNFWKSRKVPGPKPVTFFGTTKEVILQKISLGLYIKNICEEYPDTPMIGTLYGNQPALIINDMDLLRTILIRDFIYFMNRGQVSDDKVQPFQSCLALLEFEKWNSMRTKLTPTCTAKQTMNMFDLVFESVDKLDKYLASFDNMVVDIEEMSEKFVADVIAVCVFGYETSTLDDETQFRAMGKRYLKRKQRNFYQFMLNKISPGLYNIIGRLFTDRVLKNYFTNIMKAKIKFRESHLMEKYDILGMLIALREKFFENDGLEFTDTMLIEQLFGFFVAGFETTSITLSNCLYELAMNPEIQNKLREEINKKLVETHGKIDYNMILAMTYLNQVFKETLRKYPPVMFLSKATVCHYTIPFTRISLPVNTTVWIPVYAIHHDPKYYPNPNVFDPERFTEEQLKLRSPMCYLPFGDGPRHCIGLRLAQIQIKAALTQILLKYSIHVCEETDRNYVLDDHSVLLKPKNGVFLKIRKL